MLNAIFTYYITGGGKFKPAKTTLRILSVSALPRPGQQGAGRLDIVGRQTAVAENNGRRPGLLCPAVSSQRAHPHPLGSG